MSTLSIFLKDAIRRLVNISSVRRVNPDPDGHRVSRKSKKPFSSSTRSIRAISRETISRTSRRNFSSSPVPPPLLHTPSFSRLEVFCSGEKAPCPSESPATHVQQSGVALSSRTQGLLGWEGMMAMLHPGVKLRANLKPISHRCPLVKVAFVWELTQETMHLPMGCLQGGGLTRTNACAHFVLSLQI
jgi:hypothetical protein